jgi:hypothetical protein
MPSDLSNSRRVRAGLVGATGGLDFFIYDTIFSPATAS